MTPDNIDGRITGIQRAAQVMHSNIGDEFDRAFYARVVNELNREIADLQRQKSNPPAPWVQQPPQPCPLGEGGALPCYRRDGAAAVIDAGLQGKLCQGCERRTSSLDGLAP